MTNERGRLLTSPEPTTNSETATVRLRNTQRWPLQWWSEDGETYFPKRTLKGGETIEVSIAEWLVLRTSPHSAPMVEAWLRDGALEVIGPAQPASAGTAEPADRGDEANETAIASPSPSTPANPPSSTSFAHSDDYRSINFNGKPYDLTRNQATIVRILHEAYQRGTPTIGRAELLAAVESETSRVRSFFRNSPLWKTLVAQGSRQGTYRLNLSAFRNQILRVSSAVAQRSTKCPLARKIRA